jgi:hypothetical protein
LLVWMGGIANESCCFELKPHAQPPPPPSAAAGAAAEVGARTVFANGLNVGAVDEVGRCACSRGATG